MTVTGGWHESPVEQISYHVSKGGYAPFAGALKKYLSVPVIACNRIHDAETAERILAQGLCDFCGTARAFLADAAFANRLQAGKPYLPCQSCNKCIAAVLKGKELFCAFNPEAGNEAFEHQRRKIATRKECIVIGGGPAGLFSAWWLADHSDLSVCIVERGNMVKKRGCPLGKAKKCMKCDPCHILSGMGGGGLFSDGKLNFIHKLGKTDLTQFMPRSEAESLIEETEAIFDRFGMTAPVFPSDMESAKSIRKEAKKHGIDLLLIRQKHLGSDCLPNHIDGMCEALHERGVSIRTGEDVRHVIVEGGEVRGLITDKGELRCRAAILAPGRVGADWMGDMAKKYGMELQQRGIEVGVRVETHNDVMSDLTNVIYDPTFFVQTQRYDDQTRTFCTNPAGFITLENYQDFVCVNGHAYRNRKSDNTNFAFLSKVILTDPVSDSHGYGVAIGRLASLIGGGKPILQRLGDLRRGRRSTWQRIHNGYVEPTLTEVTPGDIAMALPGRIVTNLVEGLEQLNLVVPGIADDSTLLYAPEIKFFSTQVATSSDLETSVSNLFVAGDGPGVSGNIVSAAATGIIPAKAIVKKFGKGEARE